MKDLLDTIAFIGSLVIMIIYVCALTAFTVDGAIYIFSKNPKIAILTIIIAFGTWCLNRTYKLLKKWYNYEP